MDLPNNLIGYRHDKSHSFQGAAANPENEDQQQRLREAAEGLRVATNAAAQNAIKKKIVNRLEVRKFILTIIKSPAFKKEGSYVYSEREVKMSDHFQALTGQIHLDIWVNPAIDGSNSC